MASIALEMAGAAALPDPQPNNTKATICGLSVTKICYFSCLGAGALAIAFVAKGVLLPPEISADWYYTAGVAFAVVAVETGILGKWFAPLLGIQQIENDLRHRNGELETNLAAQQAQNIQLKKAVADLKDLLTKSGVLLGQMSETGQRLENVGETLSTSAQMLDDVDDAIVSGVDELRAMIAAQIERVDAQKQTLQEANVTLQDQVSELTSEVDRLGSVTTSLHVTASELVRITTSNQTLLTHNQRLLEQLTEVRTQLVRVQEIFISQDRARQHLLEQDEATNAETARILAGLRAEIVTLHDIVARTSRA